MNFINPIVLFGLIAASLPIILHLLNLRKLKTVDFSSLQFIKEMQKNKIRRVKIKQIILLTLRTLIIVSIVLAFARPTIDGSITGFESFAKSSSVILIDNSFSMDYSDENGNRFSQMKRTVSEILETMKEGDEVVIIEMANPTDSKIYNFIRNIDLVKYELETIKISYQPADLDKSLIIAAKILDNAINFSRDIFIVSDIQPNIFEQSDIQKINTKHTAVYIIPIGSNTNSDSKNYSIDSINIISRIFQVNKAVEVEGYVKNNSHNAMYGTILGLTFNNENVAQRSFDLQPTQIRNIAIGAIPASPGVVSAAIELENDAFMEDNIRYFGFLIPDKPSVAIFSNSNPNMDFVDITISATSKDGFAKVSHFLSNQIASANLPQFDLVIVADGNYTFADFNILKQYISNGGGALIFANNKTDENIFSNAMFEFGFGNVKMKEFSQSHPAQFTTTDKMHPLFDGVFKIDNDARGAVESPQIYKAMPALAGQSIINMSGGSFLAENILDDGKIIYCAVPPTLEWSNFPVTGIFPTINIRAIAYLGSHPELSYNFEIGKNTKVIIPKKYSTGGNFRIIDPNGNEFIRQAAILSSGAVIDFNDMNIPGVYTIYNSNDVVVGLVSFNLQASESDFSKLTKDELLNKINQRVDKDTPITIIDRFDDIAESIARTRTGTELWRLFIVIALLLAITEMLVQKNFKNE